MKCGTRTSAVVLLLLALPFGRLASADDEAPATDEEIVVLGLRTGVLDLSPSSFTSSVDLRDFEAEHMSLGEVLSQEVGVQLRRFGGQGERSEISIRGSTSSQVVILLDGVRINSEQIGGVDISTLPIELFERVEIARGDGSIAQGSGAIGGVVNLVSRSASDEPLTHFTVSGGSFSTWQGSLFHSRPGKWFDTTLSYSGFGTDGDYEFCTTSEEVGDGVLIPGRCGVERINNEGERHGGALSFGRDFGEAGRLRLSETVSYRSQGQPGLDSLPIGSRAGQRPFAHQRDFRSLTQLSWQGEDGLPGEGELDSGNPGTGR